MRLASQSHTSTHLGRLSGYDATLRVDEDRIGPAEFDDRGCDLCSFLVVVRAALRA
jgi:hypothetical protein